MKRYLSSAAVIVGLAFPVAVSAQHSNGGGAPSVGAATSSGGGGGSSSGGSSSGGGSSSSGGSSAGVYAASPVTDSSGHSRGNNPRVGTAMPRASVPGSGGTIVITEGSGFYPWGYAGGIYG